MHVLAFKGADTSLKWAFRGRCQVHGGGAGGIHAVGGNWGYQFKHAEQTQIIHFHTLIIHFHSLIHTELIFHSLIHN